VWSALSYSCTGKERDTTNLDFSRRATSEPYRAELPPEKRSANGDGQDTGNNQDANELLSTLDAKAEEEE
jgi:hypothetical protein